MADVPVYLFLGFLESGKTKFIQETLEDAKFNLGEKTILLCCEEGIEDYDLSSFASPNAVLEKADSESEITKDKLTAMDAKHHPERVMIEYNGMYQLNTLLNALPANWPVVQTFVFADSSTFITYNSNMRQLMYEKLSMADLVAFNRFDDKYNMEEFHKIVRVANRACEIVYEYTDGHIQPDEIEDPLPFDLEAPVVDISDRNYAIWYQDLCEDMKKYDGKTLRLHVRLLSNKYLPDSFIAGRDVMTCCAADIRLAAVACKNPKAFPYENDQWYTVEGKLEIRFSSAYGKKGPVLTVDTVEKADAPEDPVATFY